MPYPGACDQIDAAYATLVGASLLHGFRKALHDDDGRRARAAAIYRASRRQAPTAAIQMFAGLHP